jgi:3-oxoacyl-[acyl-carrier-protein] synthase-3
MVAGAAEIRARPSDEAHSRDVESLRAPGCTPPPDTARLSAWPCDSLARVALRVSHGEALTTTPHTAPAPDPTRGASKLETGRVGARILGTGSDLPAEVRTNDDLARTIDTSDEWIRSRTGIRARRIAGPEDKTSDMARRAAQRALEAAGLTGRDLDTIIVATVTPDRPLPSTATLVHHQLGARTRCAAFDLAAACGGFCYGLSLARAQIESGLARHVLVVGVELLSRIVDWKDRGTCVLFGDGAGAVVLGPTTEGSTGRLLATSLGVDGSLTESLTVLAGGSEEPTSADSVAAGRHYVKMNGQEVFKAAVKYLSEVSARSLEEAGLAADAIDWIVPHQANQRILEGVAGRLGIGTERMVLNLERYGNTSSASIPIALDEAVRDGRIQPGQHLLFCALGAGVAFGAAVVRW